MPSPRHWSPAAKLLTASTLGIILSIGLCSADGGSQNDWSAQLGVWIFLFSALGILLSILMAIISAIRGYD